ncbi:MAG: flagellar basal body rod protein FlgB [Proteobacteria bacterium]|nr:flagellar basal body rod protein FlgB [Pseudomonadota bacterium]
MNLNKIPLFAMLNERMSWLNQRQQVLANNIANADTPGYKPNDLAPVNFEKLARDASRSIAITGTDSRHLVSAARRAGPFRVTEQDDVYESTPSGNAVVLEEQLMKVSQTVMDHRITAGLYAKHLGMLRMALGRS